MPKSPKTYLNGDSNSKFKKPDSQEEAEKMATALAMDLVMQRLRDGTATSQETTYFLKLSSQRERNENELARARIEKEKAQAQALAQAKTSADLYENAIKAFRGYSGQDDAEDDSNIL